MYRSPAFRGLGAERGNIFWVSLFCGQSFTYLSPSLPPSLLFSMAPDLCIWNFEILSSSSSRSTSLTTNLPSVRVNGRERPDCGEQRKRSRQLITLHSVIPSFESKDHSSPWHSEKTSPSHCFSFLFLATRMSLHPLVIPLPEEGFFHPLLCYNRGHVSMCPPCSKF